MNQPNHNVDSGGKYVLGHSEEELYRLKEQRLTAPQRRPQSERRV